VPITDSDGTRTCAVSEMTMGSALLQKHKTKTIVAAVVNDTIEEDDDEYDESLLENQNQHELSLWLLEQHRATSTVAGSFSQYRLTIEDNYGAMGCHGDTTCIQFAELNLYHGDNEINYEGASFEQGPQENSPRRERASNAFDNNPNTKYLVRQGENTKVLTITLGTPAEVDGCSFTTANDSPARDPKRFKLEGSNDGSSWELVVDHTGEDYPQTGDRKSEAEKCEGGDGGAPEEPAEDPAEKPGSGSGDSGGSGSGDSGGSGSDGSDGSGGSGGSGSPAEEPAEEPEEEANGDEASGDGGDDVDVWVTAVNAKRADHGACPLTWAQPLGDGIKEWVDGLTSLVHADSYHIPPPGGPCGENLAWASNGITSEQAVDMWYNEVNDCANPLPGCQDPQPGKMTGHFTAMVWKGAKTMGCAISADGNYAGCRWKAGDSLSADTPNMAMPGLYEANVGVLGEAPSGC